MTGPPAYGVSGVCTGDYLRQFRELEAEVERLRARSRGLEEALVEAVIPLEVIAGQDRVKPYTEMSRDLIAQVKTSIDAVRKALSASPGSEERVCGRLLVGQGTDTYDPLCRLPEGHSGPCSPGSGRGDNLDDLASPLSLGNELRDGFDPL